MKEDDLSLNPNPYINLKRTEIFDKNKGSIDLTEVQFKCESFRTEEKQVYRVEGTDFGEPDQSRFANCWEGAKERIYYSRTRYSALRTAHQMALIFYEKNLKSQGQLEDKTRFTKKSFSWNQLPKNPTPASLDYDRVFEVDPKVL